MKLNTDALCERCGGNGVIKIPGGVSQCPRCAGHCYEPDMEPMRLVPEAAAAPVVPAERPHPWKVGIDILTSVNAALHEVNAPWRIDVQNGQAIAVPVPDTFSTFQAASAADRVSALTSLVEKWRIYAETAIKESREERDVAAYRAEAHQRGMAEAFKGAADELAARLDPAEWPAQ